MIRATIIAILLLMAGGCSALESPQDAIEQPEVGAYTKLVVLEIKDNCGGKRGFYRTGDPAYICVANDGNADIIAAHEFGIHLYRDMTNLKQPNHY